MAIVPGALALLPEYAGANDLLADLRSAAREAVEDVTVDADRVVLVTAGDREPRSSRPSIGRRAGEVMLDGRSARSVEIAWDAPTDECLALGRELVRADEHGATAVVVVADGSACRSLKAPGHLDLRAAAFDEGWVAAVRRCDAAGLAAVDPALAAELLAHGRAPLQVLAGVLGSPEGESAQWICESLEQADPYGVLYVVARLRLR